MLLREKDRQRLTAIFSTTEMPLEVWAYGSRVNGTAHDGSDLDLVVRSKDLTQLPIEVLVDVKERIRESNIPIMVQVFDWARLPATFHSNINAVHEVLYNGLEVSVNEPRPKYGNADQDNKNDS